MMKEEFLLWDIDELAKAYRNDLEMEMNFRAGMNCLYIFLEKNNLINKKVTNEAGDVVGSIITSSDLSEDGRLLCLGPKNPVHKWLGSKAGQKNPPDIKPLEKKLLELKVHK